MSKARDLLRDWRRGQHWAGSASRCPAWTNFRRGLDRWRRQRGLDRGGTSIYSGHQ
ncbi:hypothetical protein BDW68DRAFT_158156 [Aspergillus falconensis]